MRKFLSQILVLALVFSLTVQASEDNRYYPWSYDAGPSPTDTMGKEIIDLTSSIPYFPGISVELLGDQKFRPIFGPVVWRLIQKPNSMKILFIGQDATHIAEAAGRTATAGFGGRAQDLARYFGVNAGAGFINTYAYTIQGQYGSFDTPYIFDSGNGPQVRKSGYVDEKLWLMTHDKNSPLAQWRNSLIDWIIRNNRDSLKMIVLFGGAARDAAATFIESKGGKVGTRLSPDDMKNVQVPLTRLEFAGGNNEFPALVNKSGGDLYQDLLGAKPNYADMNAGTKMFELLKKNLNKAIKEMVFTQAGPFKNGLLHPGQLGGFDLNKIEIAGNVTRSLKGLPLDDNSRIDKDILVLELPHPSSLSRMESKEASEKVSKALNVLSPYVSKGWSISPDADLESTFAQGKPYIYARTSIGPEYYDFGAPESRMVDVSSASRLSVPAAKGSRKKNANVIVFGTRERAKFDEDLLIERSLAQPSEGFPADEIFAGRPQSKSLRYIFDPGPGEKFAKLMKGNLDLKTIFKTKPGLTWANNGIQAYNVKSHPDAGDFGHYRGTFENPRVLIVADPDGADDLITARALTGTRGQYLHGLMKDIGINEQYLILKTVPFIMDDASPQEWAAVLEQTATYRDEVINAVLDSSQVELIVADGPNALKEVDRILEKRGSNVPVAAVSRKGTSNDFGIKNAGEAITQLDKFKNAVITGKMANIPRSHLSHYARIWEGTSGDRVIGSTDKYRGQAFAEIAPVWAFTQKVDLDQKTKTSIDLLKKEILDNGFLQPGESVPDFLKRFPDHSSFEIVEKDLAA